MSIIVDDNDFESVVLKSDVPVLVDFFATWCGPCKMIAPAIEETSNAMKDTAKVVKVDIDKSPKLAEKYGIMSVPTLVFFKQGEIADEIVGVVPKDIITGKLEGLL